MNNLLRFKRAEAQSIKGERQENENMIKEVSNKELERKKKKYEKVRTDESMSQERVYSYWLNKKRMFSDNLMHKIETDDTFIQENQRRLASLERQESQYLEKLQRSLQIHNNISQKLSNILLNHKTDEDEDEEDARRVGDLSNDNNEGIPSGEKQGKLKLKPLVLPQGDKSNSNLKNAKSNSNIIET